MESMWVEKLPGVRCRCGQSLRDVNVWSNEASVGRGARAVTARRAFFGVGASG